MTNVTYYADELEFHENYRNLEFPHIVHIQSNGRTVFLKDENTIPALQENMFIFISRENQYLPAECSSENDSKHKKNSIEDCFHYNKLGKRTTSSRTELNDNRNISINCYNTPLQLNNIGGSSEDGVLYRVKRPLHTVEIPAVNEVVGMNRLFNGCSIDNLVLHGVTLLHY